jgi:hypothetical protein
MRGPLHSKETWEPRDRDFELTVQPSVIGSNSAAANKGVEDETGLGRVVSV